MNKRYFQEIRSLKNFLMPNLKHASIIWVPKTKVHDAYPNMISYMSNLIEFNMVRVSVRRIFELCSVKLKV